MADQLTLTGAISSLIGRQGAAILGLKGEAQRNTAVIEQLQQTLDGNKIASSQVIAQSVNDRNLPRGSLVDIRV